MSVYRVIVFCHVASVLGLFAALALEWVSVRRLGAASSYEQSREWAGLWGLLLPIGMPSTLVVLASGIYMATTLGAWELDWVRPVVPALILVAVAGGMIGPRRNRLRAALSTGTGPLPSKLREEARHRLLLGSLRFRTTVLVGLVFDMCVRPESPLGLLTLGAAAALGLIWGFALR